MVFDMVDEVKAMSRAHVAKLIKDERKRANLSQVELAELSGLSRQNIERIEAGRYNVTVDTLSLIAKALGKVIALM